jgi:hypothetical protein
VREMAAEAVAQNRHVSGSRKWTIASIISSPASNS